MNRKTLALACAVTTLIFSGIASTSFADEGQFAKRHPRRHEVNERLENQDKRIHKEVKEGEMSKDEARQLHQEDHQIRQEERDMAAQNHGHITKEEQKTLNRQENAVSREIGK